MRYKAIWALLHAPAEKKLSYNIFLYLPVNVSRYFYKK